MTISKTCFILGLPAAGKTSYLAALAYSLQQRRVETKLHWAKFSGNQQYLGNLAKIWLTAEPVLRTSIASQQNQISVYLEDLTGKIYDINFPDLSGEIFQKQYIDREIDASLVDHIINCDGFLLFINPAEIIEPELISELPLKTRLAPVEFELKERNAAKNDPTEVQLVSLLQDIDFLQKGKQKPLMIVISAWDMIKGIYSIPERFIEERTPLLWQYLKANERIFSTSYFGVSAQGGALDTSEQSEALIEQYEENPAERILVINSAGEESHDITLPLWEVMNHMPEMF